MRKITYLAVALAAIFTSAVSLQADDFAYMGTGAGDFGTIDLATGVFSLEGNFGQTMAGMATMSSTLYGASYHTASDNLYSINPTNGSLTLIGSSGITVDDFGSSSGGLYAVSTSSNLYSINATSGAATLIGNTGLSLAGFRSLSSSGGTLYFADGTNLYTLNTTTGAATLLGSTGGPGIGAMLFLNGTLYGGADSPDVRVDTLNPSTGAATSGAAVTGTNGQFYGLAAVVPEPATLACTAFGGMMLFLLGRRKAKRG